MTKCEYALQLWPILTKAAQSRKTLTYTEVSNEIEIHPRQVGAYLNPIKLYCIVKDLPPLTIIAVSQQSRSPGKGFYPGQERGISFVQQQLQVFNRDWKEINPSLEELEEITTMAKNKIRFIKSHGATYKNQMWSGSFINKEEKFIIFGVWVDLINGNRSPILRKAWEHNKDGNKRHGYRESIEHIRLIEEEGYQLKTFPMIREEEKKDNERSKTKEIIPKLTIKSLEKIGDDWYALDDFPDTTLLDNSGITLPEEVDATKKYIEGAVKEISVNAYERNGKARDACIKEHGCTCAICSFNFEEVYGDIGEGYIHVHHIKPLSEKGGEYELDPINDLIPVCPNCHAMIHRSKEQVLTVEELRKKINTKYDVTSKLSATIK